MNNKIIQTRLGSLEYCSLGNGIPILFLHGGHSNCNETLCHKGFDLGMFQLITPSRPGYGNTELKGNRTPKQAADLIAGLLEVLSLDKVIVYGVSAGGLTAIELASNYPDKVRKLILASAISTKWLNEQENIYKTAKIMFNPRTEKLIWGMVRFFSMIFPNAIATIFYKQFSKNPTHRLDSDDIHELMAAMKYYNSKTGFLNDIEQKIDERVMTKIKCPTLIIHSENDNSVSLDHPQNAHRMIENSKIEILQNEWGHLFWIGADAKLSIEKTIAFIRE